MRNFFGYVFVFTFLISIISAIFFWIRSKFSDKASEQFSKYKNFSIGIAVLSFIIIALIAPPSEKNIEVAENKSVQTQSKTVKPEKILNLGITAEQFKTKFNEVIIKSDVDKEFLIGDIKLTTGSVQDIFQYNFSENLILQGNVDKATGFVKGVWILSTPKTKVDSAELLIVCAVLIGTVNPELNLTERGKLFNELKFSSDKIELLKQSNGTAIRGNVKYTTQFIDTMGMFSFIASAKDEE